MENQWEEVMRKRPLVEEGGMGDREGEIREIRELAQLDLRMRGR